MITDAQLDKDCRSKICVSVQNDNVSNKLVTNGFSFENKILVCLITICGNVSCISTLKSVTVLAQLIRYKKHEKICAFN